MKKNHQYPRSLALLALSSLALAGNPLSAALSSEKEAVGALSSSSDQSPLAEANAYEVRRKLILGDLEYQKQKNRFAQEEQDLKESLARYHEREKEGEVLHADIASVMNKLGTVYRRQGKWSKAKDYYEKALNILKKHKRIDSNNAKKANLQGNLGIVYKKLAQYGNAQTCYKESLNIKEKLYGKTDIRTAKVMLNLGLLLTEQGSYTQAESYLKKALAVYKDRYGETHIKTAKVKENVGTVLMKRKKYTEATQYLKDAHSIYKKHYRKNHLYTTRAMGNLGSVLTKRGQYKEAEEYLAEVKEIRKERCTELPTRKARAFEIFGHLCRAQDKNDQAKIYYEQAQAVNKKSCKQDKNIIREQARNKASLGGLLSRQGKYAQAIKKYKEGLEILKQDTDQGCKKSLLKARLMGNLGNAYARIKHKKMAKKYLDKAVRIKEKYLDPTDRGRLKTVMNRQCVLISLAERNTLTSAIARQKMGDTLIKLGKDMQAKKHLEKALGIFQQHEEELKAARTMESLGNVLIRQERYDEAEYYLREVLKIDEKRYGHTHNTIKTMENLVFALRKQGKRTPQTAQLMENLGDQFAVQCMYPRAQYYLEKALKIYQKHRNYALEKARTLTSLASIVFKLEAHEDAQDYLQKALKIYEEHSNHTPDKARTMIIFGAVLMELGVEKFKKGDKKDYKQAEHYLKEALEILKQDENYALTHPFTGEANKNLGRLFTKKREYNEAERYFKEALIIFQQDKKYLEAARTMTSWGVMLVEQGQPKEGAKYLEQALLIFQQDETYGPMHPEKARTLTVLATVLVALKEYDKVDDYSKRALEIYKKHKKYLEAARTMIRLGSSLASAKAYKQAKNYLYEALNILEEGNLYGPNNHETAIAMSSLGYVLTALMEYNKAKDYLEKSLQIKQSLITDRNLTTSIALTMQNLATVLGSLGDYKAAMDYLKKAQDIEASHYGLNHPGIAQIKLISAKVCMQAGNGEEAKKYYYEALHIFRQHNKLLEAARTMTSLGNVLLDLGQPNEARQNLEQALKILKQYKAPLEIADTMSSLGTTLIRLKEYKKAKGYLEKSLKIKEEFIKDPSHPTIDLALTMKNLGFVLGMLGEYKESMDYLNKGQDIDKCHYDPHHPKIAKTELNLGLFCLRSGDGENAKLHYHEALNIFRQDSNYGPVHPETLRTMTSLANLFFVLKEYEKAKSYYEEALEIMNENLPTNDNRTNEIMQSLQLVKLILKQKK